MKRHHIIALAFSLWGLGNFAHAQGAWDLRQCINYAIEHNINIKLQENNVKNQEVSLSTSKNSRLPNLQASANESLGFGRGLTGNNTYANRNTQSTSFNLGSDVPLYTGGQITNQIKQNKLNLQAALADLEKAKENISMQVASAYLEAVYQKDLVAVAERQKELSQAQERRVELLFQNGKVSETELAEARSHVAADELSLTQQQNSSMLALLELSQLLELPTPEQFDIQQPEAISPSAVVLTAPDAIYAEALNIKPQILAGKLNVQSAEKGVRIAQAGHYPSVHFSAGMGSSYTKVSGIEAASFGTQMDDNFNQSLGISLSVPIFNRYATRNAVRQARLQVAAQQFQLEETQKALYKEIQQAYYNAVTAQARYAGSQEAAASARQHYELTEEKYKVGKAGVTDYNDARNNWLRAESEHIQARYQCLYQTKLLDFYRGVALEF